VRLARISEEVELDMPSLTYLSEHHFTPGASATVDRRGADGTVTLRLVGAATGTEGDVSLAPALTRRLFVAAF
jgi:hypothetical protein